MRSKLLLAGSASFAFCTVLGILSACSSETLVSGGDGGTDAATVVPKPKPKTPVIGEEETEPDPSTEPGPPENFDITGKKVGEASQIPIGVIGDDIIVYDTDTKTLTAQPIAGGDATKIADVKGYGVAKPTENFRVSGGAVAVWTELDANFVGKLNVWTRAGGLKELAPKSYGTLFISDAKATRFTYINEPVFDTAATPKIQSAGLIGINADGAKRAALEGAFALNMAATKTCAPQFIPGGAGSIWVKYCLGTKTDANRGRLVLLTSDGPLRVDGADQNSADTLRGETPYAPGPQAFVIEFTPAAIGGKGRIIDLQTAANSRNFEDNTISGQLVGDQLIWITADGQLKQQKKDATGTPKVLATDAAELWLSSSDGKFLGYVQKGDPKIVKDILLDIKTDPAPAPVTLGLDAKIPNGFFWTPPTPAGSPPTNLVYVSDSAYKVRDLAAGTVADVVKPAYGFRTAPGATALVYTAQTATTSAGTFFYQVGFIDDQVKGAKDGKPQTLTFALSSQIYYKDNKVIFRYARPKEGGGGIYVADLPGVPGPVVTPPPVDAGADANDGAAP